MSSETIKLQQRAGNGQQNLKQNQSNVKITINDLYQSKDNSIRLSDPSIIERHQEQQTLSQSKLDLEADQNKSKKYRKFITIGIVVLFLVGGGLGLLFGLLNRNYNDTTISEYYDLVKLNSTTALCLDGSPASYYISRNGDPSKVMLYFQGGGWCGNKDYEITLERCYQRSKTYIGSSNSHVNSYTVNEGIFSRDEKNYFKDWKKVLLSYCDGMGHQGTRIQPISYKGTLLYFRGHNITVEQLQSLEQKIGLFSNVAQIVVTGESTGGVASLLWVNYVADRAQKAKVLGIPVSSVFYDTINYQQNAFVCRQMFSSIVNISNQEIDPPLPECIQEFPNQKQKCLLTQYIYKHIKVPIFMVQSLYDTWCIQNVLRIFCPNWEEKDFSTCDTAQMQRIEQYRTSVFNLLQQIGSVGSNGAWGVACAAHMLVSNYRLYSEIYRIPEGSSNSMNEAIKRWIDNTTQSHSSIDSLQWPGNYACSRIP